MTNLSQQVRDVVEALKPFAECCVQIAKTEDDEEWAKFRLLIKDYRRARNALSAIDLDQIEKTLNLSPWDDFHGDLPDYDHPLRCVFESGIDYAVRLLAKELKVDDWAVCDGTEEFDGDLGGTLFNIVLAAMPTNKDGDPMWPEEVRGALSSNTKSACQQPGSTSLSSTDGADGRQTPNPEPVAWMYTHPSHSKCRIPNSVRFTRVEGPLAEGWTETPLYVHQPQPDLEAKRRGMERIRAENEVLWGFIPSESLLAVREQLNAIREAMK